MKRVKSEFERQEMMNILKKELNMIYGTHMRIRKSIYYTGSSSSNNNNAEFAKSSFGLNNQFHNDDLLKNIANLRNNNKNS